MVWDMTAPLSGIQGDCPAYGIEGEPWNYTGLPVFMLTSSDAIDVNALAAVVCRLKWAFVLKAVGIGFISMTTAPASSATKGRDAAGCTIVDVPMEKQTSQA